MILTRRVGDSIILSFSNTKKITFLKINPLKNQIVNSIKDSAKAIYIDFNGIKFIDTQSFECLRLVNDIAILNKRTLKFFNVSDELRELFHLFDKEQSLKLEKKHELVTR